MVLQFLQPTFKFKVPDTERAYKAKFIHCNHKKFGQVVVPENGYCPLGCTIPMNYVAREVPLHLLEWRDRRVDTALEDAADGNSEE